MSELCVVCPVYRPDGEPRPSRRPLVCEPCRIRLGSDLGEIAILYPFLPHALAPGSTGAGQHVSGSREAPLPLRVDILDLTLQARSGVVSDDHDDQTGHLPVATILDQWVRDWREARGDSERLPAPTVATLVAWLRSRERIEWACDQHPAIDEFAREIRQTAGALRAALNMSRRLIKLDPPCPRCEVCALVRDPAGGDYIECASCHTLWTEAEYARLVTVLASELGSSA